MAAKKKSTSKLQLERMDERLQMSAYTYGDTLVIEGTSNSDTAVVSTTTYNYVVSLNGYTEAFSATGIKKIQFTGFGGHDYFKNGSGLPVAAYGGDGNDTLMGGSGNDYFSGGNDHDVIFGGVGNDTSYGGFGNDIIQGNSGNDYSDGGDNSDKLRDETGNDTLVGGNGGDGLFGGSGTDKLYGGEGTDRFVYHIGNLNPVMDYSATTDAILKFADSTSYWTINEIAVADEAFLKLHNKAPRLLRDSDAAGTSLTFYKVVGGTGTSGTNSVTNGVRKIYIADWNENSSAENLQAQDTFLHEIGHNWDEESRYWNSWKSLSGWTQTIPTGQASYYTYVLHNGNWSGWYFLKSRYDNFTRDYARTNPKEDFAESFAAYFMGNDYGGVLQNKFAYFNTWITKI